MSLVVREVELLKDNVVKKIFSGDSDSSKMLMASLIEEVTNHEFKKEEIFKSMVIENPHVGFNINTVNSEVDTLLHTGDVVVNIEYNVSHYRELDVKNNSYVCNLVLRQIRSKDDYSRLKRVIQINLNNYDLFRDKEFIHASAYLDIKTKKERPNNISRIYDINLAILREIDYNNIKKEKDSELKILLYFLINNDKRILDKLYRRNNLMKDIVKKIEEVTNDLDYLFYYDKKELERMRDERERKEGFEEGIKQGIKQRDVELIRVMLDKDYSIEEISDITGRSKREIEKIKNC